VLVAGNPWRIGQGWKAPRGTATVALVAGTAIRIVDPRAAGELSSSEDVALRMGLSYVVSRLLALFHRREVFRAETIAVTLEHDAPDFALFGVRHIKRTIGSCGEAHRPVGGLVGAVDGVGAAEAVGKDFPWA